MDISIWIGIFGTLVGVIYLVMSFRNLRISHTGHAANAGRLHILMVVTFLPVMWLVILIGRL
ncbi:MAG: hypothetical protein SXU28_11155 [Pseudomonadota bacterium]|nr:hypothetical protein [Pseudomonadota bacterium]